MDLSLVYIQGFRRFRGRTGLKTNGKVVALVGPNEAGKSSVLDALTLLGNDEPPLPADISRGGVPADFNLEGHFFLSNDDLAAAHLEGPSWLIVRKDSAGERSFEISPAPPARDLSLRAKLWNSLNSAVHNKKFIRRAGEESSHIEKGWSSVSLALQSAKEDLPESEVGQVVELTKLIGGMTEEGDSATIRKLPQVFEEWREAETQQNPGDFALDQLLDRVPNFILFGAEERDLKSEYAIPSLSEGVPTPLQNLCEIAELKISDVLTAHANGNTADLTTFEHAANKNLQKNFAESWRQSGIYVTFRIQGDTLAIQVVNERSEFTSFAERSDGLRQFVALQSFATCKWSGSPVLLIDEAEQKLHYDAQADLVQMLARQDVASKVVFTTHSAGCLPEDLGNGVRFARPSAADETRSELVNKFWADNEPGFAPLLFGMGASTLAFFPTRNAVMVEGPADMLLLPTMFREALANSVLGFQFVPGLSVSDGVFHRPVLGKQSGVMFLVDGDSGGSAISKRLAAGGAETANIFVLRSPDGRAVEPEDFVDPSLLLSAVNLLLNRFHGTVSPLDRKATPAKNRMHSLEKAYRAATKSDLSKVELAYEILDILAADPTRAVLDPKRASAFVAIAESILNRFKAIRH